MTAINALDAAARGSIHRTEKDGCWCRGVELQVTSQHDVSAPPPAAIVVFAREIARGPLISGDRLFREEWVPRRGTQPCTRTSFIQHVHATEGSGLPSCNEPRPFALQELPRQQTQRWPSVPPAARRSGGSSLALERCRAGCKNLDMFHRDSRGNFIRPHRSDGSPDEEQVSA